MRLFLISVVALLGLLFPQMLLAGEEPAAFTMTQRAQQIFDQAPKTPEDLLRVIKELMDNPDINGYEFVEKVTGTDRKYWQKGSKGQGFGGNKKIVYQQYYAVYRYTPHSESKRPDGKKPKYYFSGIKISKKMDRLIDLWIKFDAEAKKSSDNFVVTPVLFRDFLGDPKLIHVTSPGLGGFSEGYYYVIYVYEQGRFELEVGFSAPGDDNRELIHERVHHTREQRRAEKKRRMKFQNHKNFQAISLRITPVNS
jgi:hypothetical protein